MIWYRAVLQKLEESGSFRELNLIGAKVRAIVDPTRFLDIHYDPTSGSYSYAFIDLGLPYPGDKRCFGWDDYPHEGVREIKKLTSYPHHFHKRADDGSWIFEVSSMQGSVESEIDVVIAAVENYLEG